MEKDILTLLNEKIDGLLAKYKEAENRAKELELEMTNFRLQKETLINENEKLKEAIALKNLELEEIVGKIESILGK